MEYVDKIFAWRQADRTCRRTIVEVRAGDKPQYCEDDRVDRATIADRPRR